MSNIEAQIKPSGISKRNLVDCLYAKVSSMQGICKKLDADGGVPSETYEANVFTAIFNGAIENSRGDRVVNAVTGKEDTFFIISPTGCSPKEIFRCIAQIFNMEETLTEQLDGDSLADTDYEALVFTALYLWTIEDDRGNKYGASMGRWIRPAGIDEGSLCDILYALVYANHLLTAKLDDDGTVTDTDYEALWDTANVLMQVEDSKGNIAGNALTKFNP